MMTETEIKLNQDGSTAWIRYDAIEAVLCRSVVSFRFVAADLDTLSTLPYPPTHLPTYLPCTLHFTHIRKPAM
jgi:hypothetical protein